MPEDIYTQDRFYVNLDQDEILWMYHNPDAVSGDQFVSNRFGVELLREAIRECPIGPDSGFEAYPVYDYIEEHCRQYLTDVGDFVYESDKATFESEPFAIGQGHSTLEQLRLIFEAKELIDQYCIEEFGSPAGFSDLKKVGIAYTTTENDKHEIQVNANLIDHRTEIYLDGELMAMQNANSLEKYVERVLPYLDFNELVDVPDWVMDEHLGRGLFRKDLEFMQHEAWNNCYDLCIEVSSYMYGGGLAMEIYDRSEGDLEPFSNLTVNINAQNSGPDCAFVDTNNFGSAEKLIRDYKLGKPTGKIGYSGYCSYPEYRFDMKEIYKYCINPEDIPAIEPKKKERSYER